MKHKLIYILFFLGVVLTPFIAVAQTSTDEQLAAQFYQNKEFDKAVDYYAKLYAKQPNFYTPYLNCLLQLDNYKKAEKVVKKQIKQHPEKPDYIVDLGSVHYQNDNLEKAESTWKQAVKGIKYDEQAFAVAKSFLEINQLDFAISAYLRGRKTSQNNYLFNFELARIYEAKGDKLAMINEYLDALEEEENYIQAVQNALQTSFGNDADEEQNSLLKTALLKRISKHPDRTIFPELLIWMQVQQKDFEGALVQAKALDKRKKEDGKRLMSLAQLAVQYQLFDLAKRSYQYVIDKGDDNFNYIFARMELLNVSYKKIVIQASYTQLELTELEANYISTIAELANPSSTAPLLKNLAHLQAFYLNRPADAIKLLEATINTQRLGKHIQADLKLELADILLSTGDIWEASLRYSQVEKQFKYDVIGQEAKFRNAKIAYYAGDFKWAQAQLDVLKGATSKLISNDAMNLSILISDALAIDTNTAPLMIFSRADLLIFQNKNDQAIVTLDSINTLFPNHALADDILYKKAMIHMKHSRYEQAAELFNNIVVNFGFDILGDDALYKLALLNENQFKKTDKAKELYQQLLESYPGSLYVVDARKRFRKLRGDTLN